MNTNDETPGASAGELRHRIDTTDCPWAWADHMQHGQFLATSDLSKITCTHCAEDAR